MMVVPSRSIHYSVLSVRDGLYIKFLEIQVFFKKDGSQQTVFFFPQGFVMKTIDPSKNNII